jgi:hypothetical protein
VIAAPLAALALALGAAPPGCALPPVDGARLPWRTGETLVLDLDLLGVVRAGTVELSVERPMSGGKIVPLRARARTEGAVGSLKRLVAVGLSWVEARSLRPERYRDESDEGGLRRMTDTRFPRGPGTLDMTWRTGARSGARTLRPAAPAEALDAVSAVYRLRAARLDPGDRFCFEAVGKGRLWRVEGSVARAPERVETPAGTFETLRLDAVAVRTDRADVPSMPVHLWLGTDRRRLLVAAVTELDIGPARAVLSEVRGAAEPRR